MAARRIRSLFGKDLPKWRYTNGATPIVASDTPIVVVTEGVLAACADDAVAQIGLVTQDCGANGTSCEVVLGLPGVVFEIPVQSDDTGAGAPVVGAQYGLEVDADGIQYLDVDETSAKLFTVLSYDATSHTAEVMFIESTFVA